MAGCVPWTDNIIMLSDSYKLSHYMQYPPGTEYVYSYFESRGCDREGWDDVCFFGLQYFLKRYLVGQVVTREKIEEAAKLYAEHFGDGTSTRPDLFYREGWEYILRKHGGRLPIVIKAVPEGMVIPNKTVLMTVVNTDPNCFWLTNFLETLLVQVWYPMTVCTNSRNQKISIQKGLEQTGNETWGIPGGASFKLHDFGFRGVSSVESAATGGLGHLVNFLGTDTVAALVAAKKYYGEKKACGYSLPASEHSTITSWGVEGEVDAMRNMLEKYPDGLVACVSDSFNIWTACEKYWGGELKDMIKGRISGDKWGRLVVRPDSGDPADTCVKIMKILCEQFAEDVTMSSTGHKILPDYIRLIQGDGVDYQTIPQILQRFKEEGFAAENITFGSGGSLLQKVNRDTFKVAFKCSEIIVNGESREVFKDPITDTGKASKKGRLTLQLASELAAEYRHSAEDIYKPRQGDDGVKGGTGYLHFSPDGKYVTVASGKGDPEKDILVEVFNNGVLKKDYTLAEIRKTADIPNGPFSQPVPEKEAPAPAAVAPVVTRVTSPVSTMVYTTGKPGVTRMRSPGATVGQPIYVTAPTFRTAPGSPGISYVAAPPSASFVAAPPVSGATYTVGPARPSFVASPPATGKVDGLLRTISASARPSYVAAPPGAYTTSKIGGYTVAPPVYMTAPGSSATYGHVLSGSMTTLPVPAATTTVAAAATTVAAAATSVAVAEATTEAAAP